MKNNNFSIKNKVDVDGVIDRLFKPADFSQKIEDKSWFTKTDDHYKYEITYDAHFSAKNDIVDILKFFIISSKLSSNEYFNPNDKADFQAKYDGNYKNYSKEYWGDTSEQIVSFKFPSPGEALYEFSRRYNKIYLSPEIKEGIESVINSREFAKAFNKLEKIENFEIKGLFKKTIMVPLEKIDKMSPTEITNVVNLLEAFEKLEEVTKIDKVESKIELLQTRDQAYASKVYELLKENHFLDKEQTRQELLEKVQNLQTEISQKTDKNQEIENELITLVKKTPFLKVFDKEITSVDKMKIFEKNNDSMIKAINALEGEPNDYTKFIKLKTESFENTKEIENLKTELSKTKAKEKGLPVENKEVIEKFKHYLKVVENILPKIDKMTEIQNKEAYVELSEKFDKITDEYDKSLRSEKTNNNILDKESKLEEKIYSFLNAKMEYNFYSGIEKFIKSNFKDKNALSDIVYNRYTIKTETKMTPSSWYPEEVTYGYLSTDINTFLSKDFLDVLTSHDKTEITSYLICEKIKLDNAHEESAEKSTTRDYATEYGVPSFNQLVSKYKTEAFKKMNSISTENRYDKNSLEASKVQITKEFVDKVDIKDLKEFKPIFETICEYKNLNVEDCKKAYDEILNTQKEIEKEDQKVEKSFDVNKDTE